MTFRPKRDTATMLVVEVLRQRDDFLTKQQLVEALAGRATKRQIDVALYWLRQSRAVDVIIQPDGTAWWYALPAELDRRQRHVDERAIEGKRRSGPRKPGGAS